MDSIEGPSITSLHGSRLRDGWADGGEDLGDAAAGHSKVKPFGD